MSQLSFNSSLVGTAEIFPILLWHTAMFGIGTQIPTTIRQDVAYLATKDPSILSGKIPDRLAKAVALAREALDVDSFDRLANAQKSIRKRAQGARDRSDRSRFVEAVSDRFLVIDVPGIGLLPMSTFQAVVNRFWALDETVAQDALLGWINLHRGASWETMFTNDFRTVHTALLEQGLISSDGQLNPVLIGAWRLLCN